ncbi:MAG: hypothetical protein M3548_17940 [Actinomycetota bacterium]|nr:hypothetical protein [Actinomycetota bacterium]
MPRKRSTLDLTADDSEATRKFFALREGGYRGPIDQDGDKVTQGPAFEILTALDQAAAEFERGGR